MLKKLIASCALMIQCLSAIDGKAVLLSDDLVQSGNSLGLELFYLLNQPGNNFVISPFGIETGLTSLLTGAQGQTEQGMRALLSLSAPKTALAAQMKSYLKSLATNNRHRINYSFGLSNTLWVDEKFPILPPFRAILQNSLASTAKNIIFSKPDGALPIINSTIQNDLHLPSEDFLPASFPLSSMQMLVTNVVQFTGNWKTQFKVKDSRKAFFYPLVSPQSPIMTKFMSADNTFPYYETNDTQVIVLPLKGSSDQHEIAFVIYFPKAPISETPFDYCYERQNIMTSLSRLSPKRLKLLIPSFSFIVRTPLGSPLQTVGFTEMFSQNANYSTISKTPQLTLTEFVHEIHIALDEYGVSAIPPKNGPIELKTPNVREAALELPINRPFLYALVDMKEQVLLMLGEFDSPILVQQMPDLSPPAKIASPPPPAPEPQQPPQSASPQGPPQTWKNDQGQS